MVKAEVNPAVKRWVYFVVYQDKANPEKPKIRVEFKNGGQVIADQTVALPEPDANGAIAMFVAAPAGRATASCGLRPCRAAESATEQIAYLGSAQ